MKKQAVGGGAGKPDPRFFRQNYDFPEAETMETRRAMKKGWSGARTFWTFAFSVAVLMTLGNYIISVISQ